ncbi:MAG: hydantoinase/oxoprolinase family protein, partial [Xanthomonadales bacterium]|nr:hydantoinase/oxoprolinase family protein [Xanthomonadales bacterium]NIX13286.1 hydantoinase/oxoprolinase family protein [Xanthomonadales bacterium]
GGRLRHCKVLSTPDDPSQAIFEGLDRLGIAGRPMLIIHGTTVGTNAVLEGKGARVAYVTSEGFADVLALGRQNRENVYDLRQPETDPPVPGEACFEVSTRIGPDGGLLALATDGELGELAGILDALDPEAVAVNLIFSFLRPEEEQRIADALPKRFFVSLSSRVLPETKEYERGIATWLDASVGPVISRYLERLQARLPEATISVMQSSGTTVSAGQASSRAVHLLLSGPAGGLAAARLAGEVTGQSGLMTFDMGGTSTDVALLDGEIPLRSDGRIGKWPLGVNSVDIHTIGAGGGSIARVDRGGMLLVGPESAGADPGPACYGRGGMLATVTDANLVLGRIPNDTLLGGYLPLERESANEAIDGLARDLSCNRLEAARGVISVANEHMARALRVISVERGHDPREYTLFCFGGAGGLHACDLAELLEIPAVMLPARAGVLSAQGMLATEPGRDLSHAVLEPLKRFSDRDINARFSALESSAARELGEEGVPARDIVFRRQLELRYRGQNVGIVVDYVPGEDHAESFHEAHEKASGHRLEHAVELVNIRSAARAPAPVASMEEIPRGSPGFEPRMVYMADLKHTVPVLDRSRLSPGATLEGPAIVTEKAATSWIAPGWFMRADEWGN